MILTIDLKLTEPGIAILQMAGRLVLGSDSMRVEWTVADLVREQHNKVIFDVAGVTMLDSTGVGILVMCHAKLKKAGGSLRIAGLSGMVEDTLKMTSLDKLIPCYPTVADASQGL